ncbi:hypothetical protein J2X14_001911 [Pantoea alhagi]|uniref:DUF2501 domain-containing protein n=1 Tax=Mixta sp. BE291 TaxID=3158787 RepID=UPI002864DF3A|nr:hypothetical protein [Pantoea alhagi]
MKTTLRRLALTAGVLSFMATGTALAASWQDQLNNAATQLSQQNNSNTQSTTQGNTGQNGLSLSSLAGLLNGGDKAVSSTSMTNAAGVMEYCVKHNVIQNNANSIKDQVLSKLGLQNTTQQAQQTDYQQGLMGLLNTGSGQQLNLKSLSNTPMGEKLKTKACDVVLKQGKNFIS